MSIRSSCRIDSGAQREGDSKQSGLYEILSKYRNSDDAGWILVYSDDIIHKTHSYRIQGIP